MAAYCSKSDLYSYGLPRGGLPNPARQLSSVSVASDSLALDQHGLVTDTAVQFRSEAGGSLPAPLAELTTYYAIPVSDSVFQVSASAGGAAIDLTTTGSRVLVIVPIDFDAAIAWGAEMIHDMAPGHPVPFTAPYPPIVVMTNAELAAGKLLYGSQRGGTQLMAIVAEAQKRLARWARGIPVRGGAPEQPSANLAVSANAARSRGWSSFP